MDRITNSLASVKTSLRSKIKFYLKRAKEIEDYLSQRVKTRKKIVALKILYIRGQKTAPFRVRMNNGRSVFRFRKPRALARGASLIDDEPDVIEFQKSYLTRRKYEVITAATTNEAIEAVKSSSPDIVFCDLKLETETSGFAILEQVKKLKPELTIYLLTGYVDKDSEEKGLSLGAKEVLGKPLSNEELKKRIKNFFLT